ncbi:LmeA family phospholipid-binding protein [Gordonia soli]|uniref:DUF2993 domain-containing protein n=1 Tax=Gordonia soli NBRC 108243 TaxID=1223545 RepID=M0QIN8_9ACTN|nr:DUF2993 domain-containing protein [Gordonia soli]GAC68398.1 hypothetical protein GS4_15_00490 [Gordonia soli NBRC 108243]
MSRFARSQAPGEPERSTIPPGRGRSPIGRRIVVVAVLAVVVAVLAAVLTDTVGAIVGEQRFAHALLASPRVTFEPEVTLSGSPYLRAAASGRFDGAVITARAVSVPGCADRGGCRAELGATLGPLDVPDGWHIRPSDTLRAQSVDAYTRLDTIALGRMLGILDLTVNTPAPTDRAGGGGPGDGLLSRTSGVLLTGTVALPPAAGRDPADPPSASAYVGRKARVSVSVDLSVRDGRLHLQATDFYDGPEEHSPTTVPDTERAAVLAAFSGTLPPLPLPWSLTATEAHSEGSDILLATSVGARDIRPDQF